MSISLRPFSLCFFAALSVLLEPGSVSHAAGRCEVLFRPQASAQTKAVVPGGRILLDIGPRLTNSSIVYLGKYGGEHRGIVAGSHDLMVVISDATAEKLNLDSKDIDFPAIQKQTEPDNCLPTALAYVHSLAAPRELAVINSFMAPSRLDPFGLSRFFPIAGAFVHAGQVSLINAVLANAGVKYHEVRSTGEVIEALEAGKKVLIGASVDGDIMRIYNEQGDSTRANIAVPSSSGRAGHAMVALAAIPSAGRRLILFADPASGELVAVKDSDRRIEAIRLAYVID